MIFLRKKLPITEPHCRLRYCVRIAFAHLKNVLSAFFFTGKKNKVAEVKK